MKLRVAFWHGKQEIQVGTVPSTLGVGGCGCKIFASVTCSSQFAKASAATLSQQEKNDTEDLQRGKSTYIRLYRHSGKLALAPMRLRRAQVVGRSFAAGAQPLTNVCTAGACDKTNSAWASGGPAGGRRVTSYLGRWRALPQHGAVACIAPARGDGAHSCPSTARHAMLLNDHIFPKFRTSKMWSLSR